MRLLLAEDDRTARRLVETAMGKWGYDVVSVSDGLAAWQALQAPDAPLLAILDWMMPKLDGVEVCRRVRGAGAASPPYLLLLTARGRLEDIVAGLEAGADDYLSKPFATAELRARVAVGARVVELRQRLADRVRALEDALARVRQLQGLLPICAGCKRIRNDQNFWQRVETYIVEHTDARFTHGICPDCNEKVLGEIHAARARGELGG